MKKEFIPYEQALALKELGFDEPCMAFFNGRHHDWLIDNNGGLDYHTINPSKDIGRCIKRPTFSQAFRWFREKYNLFCEIQIDRTTEPKFCFDIFQYEHFGNYEEIRIGEWYLYRTQEEAELECLKELIEIVKRKQYEY